jgi:hypothetical protein
MNMKKLCFLPAMPLMIVATPVQAQQISEVVATLQRDGGITFTAIREMRAAQFDTLDKDKSGGLSEEEASGALSIAGGRGGGRGGGGGARAQGGDPAVSGEQRAERMKRMQERMKQRGGQGGQMRPGGAMGAGAGGGGNPLARMQFMAADGDFNGQLTKAEFIEAPMPQLVRADTDMDGRLTVEEIQALQAAGRPGAAAMPMGESGQ